MRSVINWISYGPSALLFYFAAKLGDEAFRACGAIVAELARHPPEGLVEFVPPFPHLPPEFCRPPVAAPPPPFPGFSGPDAAPLNCG